jgi:hypothetical protein
VDTGDVVDLNDSFEVKFDAVKRIVWFFHDFDPYKDNVSNMFPVLLKW